MSQITKPIALDETLQDVVTAIQGITQGGMIVSTGNVGSATQPVYIDGGVPTAVNYNINVVSQADSTIETLVTQIKTKAVTLSAGAYSFFGSWNSHSNGYQAAVVKGEESATFWKISGTIYEYAQGRVWTFIDTYNPTTQAWSGVKIRQISGITTGTPSTSTNFTYDSSNSTVAKSGNVVQVRLKFTVSTAFTPTSNTVIATLPFKAFVNLTILPKALVISGTAYRGGTVVIRNTNQITFDTDARALSVGDSVYIWGTYLTND